MEITTETINAAAKVVTSIFFFGGIFLACYRFYLSNKAQTEHINKMQKEQTLICYGILCCLKGLKEQGCNGPVTEALNKLEKHLNEAAHET